MAASRITLVACGSARSGRVVPAVDRRARHLRRRSGSASSGARSTPRTSATWPLPRPCSSNWHWTSSCSWWPTTPGRSRAGARSRRLRTASPWPRPWRPQVPGAEASRIEIDRGGPSYSVETVEDIVAGTAAGTAGTAERPVEIFLVVGADLLPELGTWHRAEDLQRLVTLAVVSRPRRGARWRQACRRRPTGGSSGWTDHQVAVSSSEVRELLKAGRSVEGLVPDGRDPLHPPPRSVRCRQMSAMPAEWTEHADAPRRARVAPGSRAQRRAERRQELKLERRSRQRWAIALLRRLGVLLRAHGGNLGRDPLSQGWKRTSSCRRRPPRRPSRPMPSSVTTPWCWP